MRMTVKICDIPSGLGQRCRPSWWVCAARREACTAKPEACSMAYDRGQRCEQTSDGVMVMVHSSVREEGSS